jgi:NAD(P)-dependent dehydrogenase (short-subunit alcohol dehydrogenase family)
MVFCRDCLTDQIRVRHQPANGACASETGCEDHLGLKVMPRLALVRAYPARHPGFTISCRRLLGLRQSPISFVVLFGHEAFAMQVDLSGLRALVTGSTKGIGRAVAEALAKNGAEVAINGRRTDEVEHAIENIRSKMPKAMLVAASGDVATAEGIAGIIKAAGYVDILVNNASIFEIKDAFQIPDEDWQRMFATNVLSGVRLTRHYGPRMREKKFGRVVFISSESGVQIPTEMIHYGFTKAADLALMRGFAQALVASGVTVNAVLPGPTLTEGVAAMFKSMGQSADDPKAQRDFIDSARPSSIIKRLTQPQEVAEAVTFLCSREASAITGSPVRADGGVVMSIT